MAGLAYPNPAAGREAQMAQTYQPPRTSRRRVQPLPDMMHIGPADQVGRHADGAVMCGVVGVPQCWRTSPKHCVLFAVMWQWIMPCKVLWKHLTMAHLMSFSLVKKSTSLDLSNHWKAAVCIPVPLSLSTTSGGVSSISSRMACMPAAISPPYLLVWRHLQAYLEITSMQQKRYLVLSLASRYSLQSIRLHCSCSPSPDMMFFHRRKR